MSVRRRSIIVGLGLLAGLGAGWWAYRGAMSWLERTCREARDQKRWDELDARSRTWTRWQSRSAEAWLFRADAAQHLEQFSEAADDLGRVPADSAKYLPALVGRAKLLFGSADRPLDGAATCLMILDREPQHREMRARLIQFYAVTLQRPELRKQIRAAIKLGSEQREAYVFLLLLDTLRLAGAAELNERWHEQQPNEELFQVGRSLQRDERLVDAAEANEDSKVSEKRGLVAELLARFPTNLNLLSYQLELEISLGNREEAVQWLTQAPVAAEEDHRFWRYKGWVHFVRGEYPESEAAYRQSLTIHPLDWQSRHKLAELYRVLGRKEEVAPLEAQVSWANAMRVWIQDVPQVERTPDEFLLNIGGYARACGDEQIAQAIENRLGPLPKAPTRESRTRIRKVHETK